MSRFLDYSPDQHQARLVIGDPKANAYEWIKAYVEQLNEGAYDGHTLGVDELIEAGIESANEPDGWNYITKGGMLEGVSTDPMFWDKLTILTGCKQGSGNFFSCSC